MTPRTLLSPGRLAGLGLLATQTDERLVDLASAGSEPAFEAIVDRYRGPLLRYCSVFLSWERAEDAVQQTFIRAHAALDGGESVRNLRAWLYRIAHNTSLNQLRDRTLRHEPLGKDLDGVTRPEEVAERRLDLREVLSAVQALPERQRDAIVLQAFDGRSYDEIATALGVSDGAVRQLLNRARSSLRAGATAITPIELLLLRLPGAAEGPVAAACGASGAAIKICASVLVAGAAVGVPAPGKAHHPAASERAPAAKQVASALPAPVAVARAHVSPKADPAARRIGTPRAGSGPALAPSSRPRPARARSRRAWRPSHSQPDSGDRHPDGAPRQAPSRDPYSGQSQAPPPYSSDGGHDWHSGDRMSFRQASPRPPGGSLPAAEPAPSPNSPR